MIILAVRVLAISPRSYPYAGGVERVVKNVYERLAKRGYEITVCSLATSFQLLGLHRINGILYKKYLVFGPYYLPSPRFFNCVMDPSYDIVHIHSIHALTAITGLLPFKAKLLISPYYHGTGHSKTANTLWTFYRPVAKKILSKADAVIVNSNAQKKY